MLSLIDYPSWAPLRKGELGLWLKAVCSVYHVRLGDMQYSFLTDQAIQEVNRTHLKHDYPTDIITFDYSTDGKIVSGEIYIGLDTVIGNSERYDSNQKDELDRVMIHGLLHLIGYQDSTEEEKAEMSLQENNCLLLRPKILIDK